MSSGLNKTHSGVNNSLAVVVDTRFFTTRSICTSTAKTKKSVILALAVHTFLSIFLTLPTLHVCFFLCPSALIFRILSLQKSFLLPQQPYSFSITASLITFTFICTNWMINATWLKWQWQCHRWYLCGCSLGVLETKRRSSVVYCVVI